MAQLTKEFKERVKKDSNKQLEVKLILQKYSKEEKEYIQAVLDKRLGVEIDEKPKKTKASEVVKESNSLPQEKNSKTILESCLKNGDKIKIKEYKTKKIIEVTFLEYRKFSDGYPGALVLLENAKKIVSLKNINENNNF